jgi:hypothetical protein
MLRFQNVSFTYKNENMPEKKSLEILLPAMETETLNSFHRMLRYGRKMRTGCMKKVSLTKKWIPEIVVNLLE